MAKQLAETLQALPPSREIPNDVLNPLNLAAQHTRLPQEAIYTGALTPQFT
jgi:hypothetical protein